MDVDISDPVVMEGRGWWDIELQTRMGVPVWALSSLLNAVLSAMCICDCDVESVSVIRAMSIRCLY
jgi:hypothetical protein